MFAALLILASTTADRPLDDCIKQVIPLPAAVVDNLVPNAALKAGFSVARGTSQGRQVSPFPPDGKPHHRPRSLRAYGAPADWGCEAECTSASSSIFLSLLPEHEADLLSGRRPSARR